MRVLMVEDDDAIAEPLAKGLEREGLGVARAATGAAALEAQDYDVVLLDLGLPDIDGSRCAAGCAARSEVPIIVVTARGDEVDRVVGLELGADDYIVKPFGFRELLARIRAVTRRTQSRPDQVAARDRRTVDHRSADPSGRPGRNGDRAHPKEFDLLALLTERPGRSSPAPRSSRRSGTRTGTGRRRRWTSTSPHCARSSATRRGSRPCAASGSGSSNRPQAPSDVRRRLLLSYLSITVFVLLVLEIPLGFAYAQSERRRLTSAVQHDALALSIRAEDALETWRRRTGRLESRGRLPARHRFASWSSSTGRRADHRFRSRPRGPAELLEPPGVRAALRGEETSGTRHSDTLGETLQYFAVPIVNANTPAGALRVTYPTSFADDRIRRAWSILAAGGAVILGIVFLVSLRLARQVTKPLDDLERAAAELGAGRPRRGRRRQTVRRRSAPSQSRSTPPRRASRSWSPRSRRSSPTRHTSSERRWRRCASGSRTSRTSWRRRPSPPATT